MFPVLLLGHGILAKGSRPVPVNRARPVFIPFYDDDDEGTPAKDGPFTHVLLSGRTATNILTRSDYVLSLYDCQTNKGHHPAKQSIIRV
jgi:hypothetical protein